MNSNGFYVPSGYGLEDFSGSVFGDFFIDPSIGAPVHAFRYSQDPKADSLNITSLLTMPLSSELNMAGLTDLQSDCSGEEVYEQELDFFAPTTEFDDISLPC